MSSDTGEKLGLRERKKLKTKLAIQQNAIRLFHEQGYNETTVEQIAAETEISPSTFFRYFPTKEAVVLEDDYDPMMIEAFKRQPSGLSPIQAFRNTVAELANVSDAEKTTLSERMQLVFTVPELWAASLNQIRQTILLVAQLAAERTGRSYDDFLVHSFAGAIIGTMVSLQSYVASGGKGDFMELMDRALAQLESGLKL